MSVTSLNSLPIHDVLKPLKDSLKNNSRVILEAPPGAGKSTVVPISLLDELWLQEKMIIMLEPRRVAARMVATRMAEQLHEKLGERVGYQVKMEQCYSKKTKILVVTEAILVRKLQNDQSLEGIDMIIFDEFHERSIHSDLALALSLQVQELLRDDLKLLIMSATLNTQKITALLGDVPRITSQGRLYEVNIQYLDIKTKQPDFRSLNAVLLSTILQALEDDEGDILVFLAGVKEIKNLQNSLKNAIVDKNILIFPLYSSLSKQEQVKAIAPAGKRKIILSTNIAQTSLTIEGVQVVIDSGLEKRSRYNYATGMDHLELAFISQDAATQRAGRAGRTQNGKCYRLWHESKILPQSTNPEILRADLTPLMLELALWGVQSCDELQFLETPNAAVEKNAQELLQELKMLDASHTITPFGVDALRLGIHPRFAYMILQANEMGYAYEACLLAALLSEGDILSNSYRESDILSRFIPLFEGDLQSNYINSYRAKEVLNAAELLFGRLQGISNAVKKNDTLKQDILAVLLLFAYPDRLARRRAPNDNRYILSNAKGALLHTEDSLFNQEYLVVANLHAQEKDSLIQLALSIDLQDIEHYFSSFITKKESVTYNKEAKRFDIRANSYFLQLQLSSKALQATKKHDFVTLFISLIQQEGLELLTWSKKAKQLQQRVELIRSQREFIDLSDTTLLATLEIWLAPYLEGIQTIKELEALDIYTILLARLSWQEQQILERMAPQSIKVPSGSNIRIDYTDLQKPSMQVKIQELFGLQETPKILDNTLPLQLHLLTPAMTPIQITYDLKSFWANSYEEVRKELRGKYKKHYWPEDPFSAIATTKTKKQMMRE